MLQETEVLNASTCKCRKVCMHTEIEKENKTVSPEDSTVKLNTSLFLRGLENALKTRKQNNQTNKKQNTPKKYYIYENIIVTTVTTIFGTEIWVTYMLT